MKIYTKKINLGYKKLFKKLFKKTLFVTGNYAENLALGIKFVKENEIQALNKEHRNIDKVTDVLSFPMLDIDYKATKICDFEGERNPNGELYVGDIVICLDVAKVQAQNYKHSLKRELAFLAVHGMLHCLGYDHIESKDEIVMMNLAENILLNFNIKRGD